MNKKKELRGRMRQRGRREKDEKERKINSE